MTALPEALARAILEETQRFAPEDIRKSAEELSHAYRARAGIRASLSARDRAAYVGVRFPSTFAVASAVWFETLRSIPSAHIKSVLDVGAGPGTASLALAQLIDVAAYTYIERDAGWRDIAERLARSMNMTIAFRAAALTSAIQVEPHDIVVASYALGELSPGERSTTLPMLWKSAKVALVLIEPGTPAGFETVRAAREWALREGAHAALPCTHDAVCPMSTSDWCHRPVRVTRSDAHRAA
jgi:ribosomal protein RSM22 (predicted rRNA methylase)